MYPAVMYFGLSEGQAHYGRLQNNHNRSDNKSSPGTVKLATFRRRDDWVGGMEEEKIMPNLYWIFGLIICPEDGEE